MWRQLGIERDFASVRWAETGEWGTLVPGTRTAGAEPIFPRIEREVATIRQKKEEKVAGEISFEEFKKLDLRVAEVKAVDRVPGADKLLKLTVSLDSEERTIVAGIAEWYTPDSLIGKKIVLVANLAPATIRGVESKGMLLAADVDGRAVILTADPDVPAGAPVR